MLKKTLPRYDGYLQLHDNHTYWKLECNISDIDLQFLTDDYLSIFKEETGVEILLLGRMGRHVCIEDTPENSRHYQALKRKALKLEKDFILTCNNAKY